MHLQVRPVRRLLITASVLAALGAGPATAQADTMPMLVTSPAVTGTVMAGKTVSCDGAAFSGDNLTITYDWNKTGSGPLGTGQTYTPTRDDIGWDITCRATAMNDAGSAEGFSEQMSVEDGTPNNDALPKITGKAWTGLVISCSQGTWSGDGNTYTYQWISNDKPIPGATKNTLLITENLNEKTVTCRVTATNASGTASIEAQAVSPYHPAILAPWSKLQPALPKIPALVKGGLPRSIACNTACSTESTAFVLTTDAQRLGIKGKDLGGLTIVGKGHAHRSSAGALVVTTIFTASAKKGLAKAKSGQRVDVIAETAWGPKYSFKMYHVVATKMLHVKR